jgi:hypothetical protein
MDNRLSNDTTGPTSGFILDEDGRFMKVDYPEAAITGLFDTPGAVATFGRGVNDRGIVVGNYRDDFVMRHAFVSSDPAMTSQSSASLALPGAF